MARWDPDKHWLGAVRMIAELKRQGWRPLFIARGGTEPHGAVVLGAARHAGLVISERALRGPGPDALADALTDTGGIDVVSITTPVDPTGRRVLFRSVDSVLANSRFEPFGLVGLETMAVGGIATTGCTGEDYALPGRNSLVLHTDDPREFIALYGRLRENPGEVAAMRRAGRMTARQFAWPEVVRRNLLPWLEMATVGNAASRRPSAVGAAGETSAAPLPAQPQRPATSRGALAAIASTALVANSSSRAA